jgi:hypothetical protein
MVKLNNAMHQHAKEVTLTKLLIMGFFLLSAVVLWPRVLHYF